MENEAIKKIIDIFGIEPSMTGIILGAAGSPSILASISYAINTAALMAATILVIWTGVTAAMNTAHEGEQVMGRDYNSMWVPLRSALSIAFLVPMVSGYSLIQVFVMVTAATGFKAADLAWNKAIDHLHTQGGIISVAPPQSDQLGIALFKSSLCMVRTNGIYNMKPRTKNAISLVESRTEFIDSETGGEYGESKPKKYRTYFSYDGIREENLGRGICGVFAIEHEVFGTSHERTVALSMHNASVRGVKWLRAHTHQIAIDFLHGRYEHHREPKKFTQQQTADRLNAVIAQYNAYIQKSAAAAIRASIDQTGDTNTRFFREARDSGWMMAGSWFWTISAMNRRVADIVKAQPAFSLPNTSNMPKHWEQELQRVENNVNKNVIRKMRATTAGTAGFNNTDGGVWSGFKRITNDVLARFIGAINKMLNEKGEPEIALQSFGHVLITTSEAMVGASLAAKSLAASAEQSIAGIAAKLVGAGGVSFTLINWIITAVVLAAIPLFICGLVLAFWFPAVPFINWIAAIMGWLVMLVEAVVAAPFWAAAHAIGAGSGMAGQHGRQGYMLILSLVSRPVLMIAGLFGAFLVMHYSAKFLLYSFVPFVQGMNAGSVSGLVSIIAMCILLVALSLIVANRAWSLIYAIPDRVLAWIGANAPQLGEQQTEQESKQMFIAAGAKGSEAGGGAMKKMTDNVDKQAAKAEGGQQGASNQDHGDTASKANLNRREEEKLLPGNVVPKSDQKD